jgi:hypothetical protein
MRRLLLEPANTPTISKALTRFVAQEAVSVPVADDQSATF